LTDSLHDPGPDRAAARALSGDAPTGPIVRHGAEIRVGTGGWTDKTLTASGVFYPADAKTPETRLRYYASRFPMVEADMGFYAIPDRTVPERWVERTPDDFLFNFKAHALMTGHATDVARLPRSIREALPPDIPARIYMKDLPAELRAEVWRLFRIAAEPLHEAGKLGAILLQYGPWTVPNKQTPAMVAEARRELGDLPIAMEFRNPAWMEPRLRERLWALLRDNGITYVVPDTIQGTPSSMPLAPAVTTPDLAIVRLHGRSDLWAAREATVLEKYRYLYDANELEEWLSLILELAEEVERVHVIFNNCYANYGTTNAAEMAGLLSRDG